MSEMKNIGNTPLVRLDKIDACLSARVFAKVEGVKPAGSIKERVAFAIVDDAEKSGRLTAGGTVIEATSGNTGIGLAYVCKQRGYRAVIVMPDSMSVERRKLLADYGAEVVLTDGAKGMSAAVTRAQEILQNTLDRYDDLVAEGKVPEAAYRLAISGIGDINEILGRDTVENTYTPAAEPDEDPAQAALKKTRKAVAIAFYILCPVPVIILSEFGMDTLGLCLTLLLVAAATTLLILNGKDQIEEEPLTDSVHMDPETSMRNKTRESIHSLIWYIGLAGYLVIFQLGWPINTHLFGIYTQE